jgi:hypothetical protein
MPYFVKSLIKATWSIDRVITKVEPGMLVVFNSESDVKAICEPEDGQPRGVLVTEAEVQQAIAELEAAAAAGEGVSAAGHEPDEEGVTLAQHTDNTKASMSGQPVPHKPKAAAAPRRK